MLNKIIGKEIVISIETKLDFSSSSQQQHPQNCFGDNSKWNIHCHTART